MLMEQSTPDFSDNAIDLCRAMMVDKANDLLLSFLIGVENETVLARTRLHRAYMTSTKSSSELF